MRHMQIKVELNPKTFYLHNKKLSQHGRQTWHYCVGWGGMSAHQGPFWSTITWKNSEVNVQLNITADVRKKKKQLHRKLISAQHRLWKQKNDTKINKKDTKIHRMKTKWWHLFACVQYFTGPWLLYVKNKTRLGNLASVFCEPSHTWWQIYHCCMSYWSGMKEHISIDAESQWPLNRSEYFLPQAVGVSSCCGC